MKLSIGAKETRHGNEELAGLNEQASARRTQKPARGDPEVMKAFSALAQSALAQGALDGNRKELIAIAISVAIRCDDCIGFQVKAAVDRGASARKSSKRWAWRSIWERGLGDVRQPRPRRLYQFVAAKANAAA